MPLIDKKKECDVMWVGLSAKKVNNLKTNYPLEEDTNSGKIIKEVEDLLPNVQFYKTNLVKCLPLDDNKKIRYPNKTEMEACINNLVKEIEYLKPKIVFLLGNKVNNFVIGHLKQNNIIIKTYIKKIQHPSYIHTYKRKNKQDYINNLIIEIKNGVKK
ncbi:MAG: hypothetical protein E7163_05710 [Firmicutes bacterium]|nr:hypothetical protein [Bacillota bacterium]